MRAAGTSGAGLFALVAKVRSRRLSPSFQSRNERVVDDDRLRTRREEGSASPCWGPAEESLGRLLMERSGRRRNGRLILAYASASLTRLLERVGAHWRVLLAN